MRGGRQQLVGVGAVAIDGRGVFLERLFIRNENDRKRAFERRADIRKLAAVLLLILLVERVGLRLISLADADQQLLAIGSDGNSSRIPAGGNESLDLALALFFDVDDRDAVVV